MNKSTNLKNMDLEFYNPENTVVNRQCKKVRGFMFCTLPDN